MPKKRKKSFRSQKWFNNPKNPDMTALYLERYLNYGLTRKELQSGNPIIGIAQSGSDLSPCNRHFMSLSKRIKDGVRRAGGIPMEFPTHPIQETGKRPFSCFLNWMSWKLHRYTACSSDSIFYSLTQ